MCKPTSIQKPILCPQLTLFQFVTKRKPFICKTILAHQAFVMSRFGFF